MTDRVHSLNVVLESNIRTDDVQPLIDSIMMFRGVVAVTGNIADNASHMAYERVRSELSRKLLEVIHGTG